MRLAGIVLFLSVLLCMDARAEPVLSDTPVLPDSSLE